MNSSETPKETWKEKAINYAEQKGKITNGFGLASLSTFTDQMESQSKRAAVDDEVYRRQMLGGDSEPPEDDEMKQFVLGDYTEVHEAPKQSSPIPSPPRGLSRLAVAALAAGALGPAGMVGGYLLSEYMSKPDVPVVQPVEPGDDETADLKLGRIQDYE